MADIRQSPYWALFMEELGWDVIKIGQREKSSFVYSRSLPFFGKLLKIPRLQVPLPIEEIETLAKEKRAFFTKVEPDTLDNDKTTLNSLKEANFHPDRWSLHPTKTITLDLRKGEDELLAAMEKDTRYSVRASQRRGVRIVRSNDINRFLTLYRQTAARKKFFIPEEELKTLWDIFSNEGKAFILIAQWNKADIAGCLILHYDKVAYYYHAASVYKFRELFAPYHLIWEALLTSKHLGLKDFDLEGIYDHRIPGTKKWKGFSHFKRGFGGEEKIFAGSFTKHYSPISKLISLPERLLNFQI